MAASYHKRRAGLSALLKNKLATLVPTLHAKGLISDRERDKAMDVAKSQRERADSLVAAIGRKIKTNETLLKDFLSILREVGIGHMYVRIMEREAQRPERSAATVTSTTSSSTHTSTIASRSTAAPVTELSSGREMATKQRSGEQNEPLHTPAPPCQGLAKRLEIVYLL